MKSLVRDVLLLRNGAVNCADDCRFPLVSLMSNGDVRRHYRPFLLLWVLKVRGGFSFEMAEDGGSAIWMRSRLGRLSIEPRRCNIAAAGKESAIPTTNEWTSPRTV